ncbi:PleD family two-component system response regulator [Myxococcota bacterium]
MKEKPWVLILDDSEIVLETTAMALTEAGFEVVKAQSLVEFDRLLTKGRPDIILTDIKMPEITGDDVCGVLKQKHDTKNIPIILFSTMEDEELAQLAEKSGADGYVCKGEGMEEIVKHVRALAEKLVS